MKIKDFEKAIEALNYGVEIDEIKLKGGQVRLALGHNRHTLLLWDENGRGFTVHYDEPFFCTEENHDYNSYDDYSRDVKFDLKFE